MQEDEKEYSWSWDNSDFSSGTFDSIDDAISDAIDSRDDGDRGIKTEVYVAEVERVANSKFFPSASWVIEHMQEMAWGEFGDLADGYAEAPLAARQELDSLIDEMLGSWCKKHKIEPSFYRVMNSRIHEITK